jgi:hypothetical protein
MAGAAPRPTAAHARPSGGTWFPHYRNGAGDGADRHARATAFASRCHPSLMEILPGRGRRGVVGGDGEQHQARIVQVLTARAGQSDRRVVPVISVTADPRSGTVSTVKPRVLGGQKRPLI